MTYQILALIIVLILMSILGILPIGTLMGGPIQATLGLGFIILAAYIFGMILHRIKLPKITGYMVVGVLAGPFVLDFLTVEVVRNLGLIDQIALSLIAFSAGRKLKIKMLKKRLKPILMITLTRTVICFLAVFLFTVLAGPFLFGFLQGQSQLVIIVVGILFGIFALATSPVQTIAIIEETHAEGRTTDTILGSVILGDLVIIVLAAISVSLSQAILSDVGIDVVVFRQLVIKLAGSFGIGIVCGAIISFYLHYVREESVFFVLAAAFICTQIANVLGLDALLLCLSAGFVIENLFKQGDAFLEAISKSAIPIYVIFFSITAASLDLNAIRTSWYIILLLLIVRKISLFAAVYSGTQLAKEDNSTLRHWGWMAFFNQSGVTLALAVIIGKTFPEFGSHVKAVALGMVAFTDFYGPALLKLTLWKAGEIRSS
ncbi:MAG: hypothetical protein D6675_12040 [Gemmatimonadetes bacterium]|nr:MAG: hypothetical protein D6675_12040 [Gemmatimonadota bacterium]